MVETKVHMSSAMSAASAVRKSPGRGNRFVNGPAAPYLSSPAYAGRRPSLSLTLQQPAWAAAEEQRRKQARAKLKLKRGLRLRGEAAAMVGVVSSFAAACTLGIVYLAAYAGVAAQGHQIHNLQMSVRAAQAQHEILVQQLTHLSSTARIQALAAKGGMVSSGPTYYVTLTAAGQDAQAVSQVAMAK